MAPTATLRLPPRPSMDERLRAEANRLLSSAPVSVEMPAGTGKTHLLAAAVATASESKRRCLVLTHTNAGVDAIQRRLRKFGVDSSKVRVETLTSWAFALVRAYSTLAELSVHEIPDWSVSSDYIKGATRVVTATAVQDMLKNSFNYLFVDEYQDCTRDHHVFIQRTTRAIPQTVLLGDRLQAIFGFADPLVDWNSDVLPHFPPLSIDIHPYRWMGHNPKLGQWILAIRNTLMTGGCTFDLGATSVPGLTLVPNKSPASLTHEALKYREKSETTVLLDKWPKDVARHTSRLRGKYTVMEDINGNFMRSWIKGDAQEALRLPDEADPALANWFACFAKACIIGLGGINKPLLEKLRKGDPVSHLKRDGMEPLLWALDHIYRNPTYDNVCKAARVVESLPSAHVYRREAWRDTLAALRMCTDEGTPPLDNLAMLRERLRKQGRRAHTRIASRTLLVKGLEYDHVIIANTQSFRDPKDLYVALSRARKSVTLCGPRVIRLTR